MSVFDKVIGHRFVTYLGSEFFLGSRIVVVLDHEEGEGEPVDILWKIGTRMEAVCVGKSL